MRKKSIAPSRKGRSFFMTVMLFYPLLQFAVFYVGVNIENIILSLKEYDRYTMQYSFLPTNELFSNFKNVINDITKDAGVKLFIGNSMLIYLVNFSMIPINILVSYCIYKKVYMAELFKVLLFLPSIVAGMVYIMVFRYLVEYGLPVLFDNQSLAGLLTDPDNAFGVVVFYSLWLGLAGNMILYTGTMARIPPSLVEYGQLEGINALQEVWYLVVPMIFPLITTFIVTSIVGIFSNQGALYSFYGAGAPYKARTFGYYMFVMIIGENASPLQYPYASAAGLMFTLIATPITLFVKWALEKYGPNVEY